MAELSQAPTAQTSKALGTDFSTLPIREQYAQVKTPAQAKEASLMGFEQQRTGAEKLAEQEAGLQVTGAEQKLKAIEDYGTTQQNLMGEYKTKKESMPFPEFHPTQDNASDLMTLFSVVGTIGTAMGASGKNASLGALKSMTGMMKGYREGRADLFTREKAQFEKDFKVMQIKHEEIAKDLNLALQLSSTDRDKAMAVADVAIAKAGSPILREKARLQGLGETVKFWNQVGTDLQSAADKIEERKIKQQEIGIKAQGNVISATDLYLGSDGKAYAINKIMPIEKQLPEGVSIVSKVGTPSGAGGVGAVTFRYNSAVAIAANELANGIELMVNSPVFAKNPVLDTVLTNPAEGVTQAIIANASQKVTEPQARAYQQIVSGISRAETVIFSGGRPGGQTKQAFDEIAKQAPREGDNVISTYLWLGLLKQTAGLAEKELLASGGNAEQLRQVKEVKEKVNNLVPYSALDVMRVIRGDEKKLLDAKVTSLLSNARGIGDFEQSINNYGSIPTFETRKQAVEAAQRNEIEIGQPVFILEIDRKVPQRLKGSK